MARERYTLPAGYAPPTLAQIAARFGCTVDQCRAQFRANAEENRAMAEKLRASGKARLNGYTLAEWESMASKAAARANEPAGGI